MEDFIRNEEENFALFNYVNELNSEVEMLQEEVGAIKKDIDQYKKEDTESDNKKDNLMISLEVSYITRKYLESIINQISPDEITVHDWKRSYQMWA